jgi:hypothetical protein
LVNSLPPYSPKKTEIGQEPETGSIGPPHLAEIHEWRCREKLQFGFEMDAMSAYLRRSGGAS